MNNSMTAGQSPTTVLKRVERELAEMWAAPPTPGELPKCRACTMNLVVVAAPEIIDRYVTVVDDVTRSLPARAIVVSIDPRATDGLVADATAVCSIGDAQAICSERVTLRATGSVCARVASAIDALSVPEMPTTVVWLGPVDADDPLFTSVARVANRIVTDSEYTSIDSFVALAKWARSVPEQPEVADIAWTRLAVWQELCARFFDEPRFRAHASRVARLEVTQASGAGEAIGPEAALFVAWVATRLGWTLATEGDGVVFRRDDGVAVDVRLRAIARPEAVAPAALARVTLEAEADGVSIQGSIERELASGLPAATPDTDVVVWRLDAPAASARGAAKDRSTMEQRVRLRTNRGARLLERTLHRPMRDDALIEAVALVERWTASGLIHV